MCRQLILTICFILVLCLAGVGSADMVAYWDFEGDFGDAVGGNDATPVGDTAVVLDPDRGRVAQLDGNGDYIEIPNSPSLNITGNAITIPATGTQATEAASWKPKTRLQTSKAASAPRTCTSSSEVISSPRCSQSQDSLSRRGWSNLRSSQ